MSKVDTKTLSTLTTLGCDNDSTVQTARTIKCSCSSTLQYRYGFKVSWVQVLQFVTVVTIAGIAIPVCRTVLNAVVQDNTVHYIDRLVVCAQSRSTTNHNLVATEHTTVTRVDFHTGNLTLQCRYRVDHVGIQVFALHFCYGITQSLLFTLHTESGYYHFFQSLSIILQNDVERSTVPCHFYSLITYE